jgi:hypothetical protein
MQACKGGRVLRKREEFTKMKELRWIHTDNNDLRAC